MAADTDAMTSCLPGVAASGSGSRSLPRTLPTKVFRCRQRGEGAQAPDGTAVCMHLFGGKHLIKLVVHVHDGHSLGQVPRRVLAEVGIDV